MISNEVAGSKTGQALPQTKQEQIISVWNSAKYVRDIPRLCLFRSVSWIQHWSERKVWISTLEARILGRRWFFRPVVGSTFTKRLFLLLRSIKALLKLNEKGKTPSKGIIVKGGEGFMQLFPALVIRSSCPSKATTQKGNKKKPKTQMYFLPSQHLGDWHTIFEHSELATLIKLLSLSAFQCQVHWSKDWNWAILFPNACPNHQAGESAVCSLSSWVNTEIAHARETPQ